MSAKIKLSEAKDLYVAYRDDKRSLLLQKLQDDAVDAGELPSSVDETKYASLSLTELKSYIAEIEAEGAARQISASDLGFHIYFGAYPSTHATTPNQLTAFFVPTLKNTDGTENGFVYTNDNGDLDLKTIKSVTDIDIEHEESSIFNRLTLCPPPKTNTDMDEVIANAN